MGKHQKIKEEYDWLNDPFDEKKTAEDEMNSAKMSSGSKIAVSIGCLAILIIVVAIIAVSCSSIIALTGAGAY